jgi:hypothetical protein
MADQGFQDRLSRIADKHGGAAAPAYELKPLETQVRVAKDHTTAKLVWEAFWIPLSFVIGIAVIIGIRAATFHIEAEMGVTFDKEMAELLLGLGIDAIVAAMFCFFLLVKGWYLAAAAYVAGSYIGYIYEPAMMEALPGLIGMIYKPEFVYEALHGDATPSVQDLF